jgi:hypothetical protein
MFVSQLVYNKHETNTDFVPSTGEYRDESKKAKRAPFESNSNSLPTPAPQPQPLPNIDPTQFNYALSIVADTYGPDTVTGGLIGTSARVWRFFPTYYQKAVGCQPHDVNVVQKIVPKVDGKPYHVDGITVPLDLFGNFCEYKNSGGTYGTLWCGKTGIKCKEDDHTTKDCGTDTDKFSRQAVFVCDIKNLDFTKRDAPEMTKIPTPPSQPTDVVKTKPAKREAPTTTLISLPQSAKVTKREESKPYWSSPAPTSS